MLVVYCIAFGRQLYSVLAEKMNIKMMRPQIAIH